MQNAAVPQSVVVYSSATAIESILPKAGTTLTPVKPQPSEVKTEGSPGEGRLYTSELPFQTRPLPILLLL